MFTPPFQGLASHGATITILLAVYLYARTKPDQSFLWVVDRGVIPVALGGAFIRFGNLLNSEIYGIPTSLPWGFLFVRETDPSLLPLIARHPTQLYESLFCLFLLGVTFYLWKYKRYQLPEGFITGIFIVLLFSFRFVVEFLKNDQSAFEASMQLNMGQWLSIPAIITGIIILFITKADKKAVQVSNSQ
jgi:prolipoprotein diacylglyceryl transferase